MSRVGKKPIDIPKNVKIDITGGTITVEGPKGKLEYTLSGALSASVADSKFTIKNSSEAKKDLSL